MVEIKNIKKSYNGEDFIVKGINLTINEGEIIALIGQSGSGKSTLLRMINRLIEPTEGDIIINGDSIFDTDLIKLRRNMGYVIQKVGLMPHLTIGENITLISKVTNVSLEERKKRAYELLKLVDLDPEIYHDKMPNELSGGQQQRVGVARALCLNPDIILMDEPFSALDPITRESLQNEILFLQETLNKTIIFVTHDMDEALRIADRIAFLQDGKLVQVDTPENVLKNPKNDYIRNFIGKNRLWQTPEYLYAKDIMNTEIFTIGKNRTYIQALEEMQNKHTTTCYVVNNTRDNKLVGVLRVNEIEKSRYEAVEEIKVSDIMETQDLTVINENDTIQTVLHKTQNEKYKGVGCVVNDDGVVMGVITAADILNILSEVVPSE